VRISRSTPSVVSDAREVLAIDASEASLPIEAPAAPQRRHPLRSLAERAHPRHAALGAILALSAVLNTNKLAQNGYGNTFYSAAVKSMLHSLHNFLFVSFDPGGLVTIDKPPLAVWVQVASAKVFGFSPLSLLLPGAILSTIGVAALYRIVAPRLGAPAALLSALALAVFPSFVAVSRDNGVDPLLILLLILACGAALSAIETGRWRSLLCCAVIVGLAFNTKTLAAYLVLPGIALGYVLCAPGPLTQRLIRLMTAGVVMLIVSFAWIAFVELTPASQRPYVGSSTNNTEIGLTFGYNGFGRVEGEIGGPGRVPVAEGAGLHMVPRPVLPRRASRGASSSRRDVALNQVSATASKPKPLPSTPSHTSKYLPDGRLAVPLFFARPPGPLRLFRSALNDQAAWLLPFALLGLIALAVMAFAGERARRNQRLATLIVFGGWMIVEAVILSFSKGIVHPYYASAMAPGAAVMVGGGALAFAWLVRHRHRALFLLPCAVAASVAVQIVILSEQEYMSWLVPVLIVGALVGMSMTARRRLVPAGIALTLGVLMIAPTVYASATWLGPVEGTFPAAGPREATAEGPLDVSHAELSVDRALMSYVDSHRPAKRWAVLTDASPTAAPLILLGMRAGALGGYGGTDPALDGPQLARLVRRREARYVVLGGDYASRGGNLATKAVLRSCRLVPYPSWHGPPPATVFTFALFDCAGREAQLERDPTTSRS
jgi:4-amino-4-deoxy-L-arabinose transferase-like glycosyltransferase